MNTPFVEFPKIPRLSRPAIVTEKIDGTNACVCIVSGSRLTHPEAVAHRFDALTQSDEVMLAGSRTRWITPLEDNFGFAAWVFANSDALWSLGQGTHFGEWWGSGVQRGYGLPKGEKRFSLFNVSRWDESLRDVTKQPAPRPVCCGVVPILITGEFDMIDYDTVVANLSAEGSRAAPGFAKPEGIVVFHVAGNIAFKKTIEKNEVPKSMHA